MSKLVLDKVSAWTPVIKEAMYGTMNILNKAEISSIEQLSQMTDAELLSIPSFGAKSLDELKEKLGASK